VALPMDEQRILEEMERKLAADDPRLAAQLASFGRPGLGRAIRSRRARSMIVVVMLATVAVMIYAMIAFRLGGTMPRSVPHVSRPASSAAGGRMAASVPPPQLTRGPGARIRP
jgi:DUF3040 family protein